MYKIGDVRLKNRVIMAPLTAVNCPSYRLLCSEYDPGLIVTQTMWAYDFVKDPKRYIRQELFETNDTRVSPLSIQVGGNKGDEIKETVQTVEQYADIIDVNFGCPLKEALGNRSGAFFTKHPEQIAKVISAAQEGTNKPVTAKVRIGWDNQTITLKKTIQTLNDCGVHAITIHGRTKSQSYDTRANWQSIKEAKQWTEIPIVGNGDILSAFDARAMIERTGCDFVMPARALKGNPFILKQCVDLLEYGTVTKDPDDAEVKSVFLKFADYYSHYEKNRSFTELQDHARWFSRRLKNKTITKKVQDATTFESLLKLFE